ncbi:MAG: hypothetical protein KA760_16725 [Steroidobacteraceae bacterium]|jgi:hypothetical protein|nr:hypothetical protein [Steroidobacteraceae bacterium]
MTPGDLLTLFRSEVSDVATPYLWSDDEFFGYADDAQKQFARLTWGLIDSSTTAIVDIPLVAGTNTYDLSPLILAVRAARVTATGRGLDIVNQEDMPVRRMYFDGTEGVPQAVILGMDTDKISVWPVPIEDEAIKLSVFRLPLVDITSANETTPFEIAPQHHRHLLLWVKHLAYLKQDAETYDRIKAAEFEAAFEAYCARAKKEQDRSRHKPRSVTYGGI